MKLLSIPLGALPVPGRPATGLQLAAEGAGVMIVISALGMLAELAKEP